jgi:Fe-Mn family superoxide dismutase
MMNRRQAIKTTVLASAAFATLPGAIAQNNSASRRITLVNPGFTLPPLPYAYDALEPFIDAETMRIHHDKHHAAYVANLNKDFEQIEWEGEITIEYLLQHLGSFPENIRTDLRNNGSGHYNHSLFWQMMKPANAGVVPPETTSRMIERKPTGELAKAIDASFGSFSTFKEKFNKSAVGQFGSGWAWLVWDSGGADLGLKIESTPNQDSPISENASVLDGPRVFKTPLLGLDVWEHAYYLKYQNKRAD